MPPHAPSAFGEAPYAMDPYALGTDLLTFSEEPPKQIVARPLPVAASKFLPRSGRRQIRDTLTTLMEHMRTEVEKDGLELIVDVVDEQAEQQLWRKDDAAWYWLAAGGPNTLHTSEHDVLKMHNATLRRIVDPASMAIVEEQIELSKLPPDPEQHVPLERWVASKPKEDIVWEYLQNTMRVTYRLPPSADVPADRMRMELNSVTLYIYLVTMNPSAYGTHVRTLLQGAYRYALHHLLAARHLARTADEYVAAFVGAAHKPLVSGVLASAEVNRSLDSLLELHTDNKDDAHSETSAAKTALISALDRTSFIQTVKGMLQRNTVRVDDRDPNFAYVFGLYKTLALIRGMCKWMANSSMQGSSKQKSIVKYQDIVSGIDRVDIELRRDLSTVGQDEGAPLGEASQSVSTKLMRRVRAVAEVLTKLHDYSAVTSKTHAERAYLVRLLSEANYSTGVYYARLNFAASISAAAKTNGAKAVHTAKFAQAYKSSIERLGRVKRMLAEENRTVTQILSGSSPTKSDISRVAESVLRMRAFGGIERRQFERRVYASGSAMHALKTTPLVADTAVWIPAIASLRDWYVKAMERADTLGYDARRGSMRIDLSMFGESRFGAHDESRTESTIRFINIFFLTGLYQTLDTLDGKVGKVIFDTGRDDDGRLVTLERQRRHSRFGDATHAAWARGRLDATQAAHARERREESAVHGDYKRKINELRAEVVMLLEILRNGARYGVPTGLSGNDTRTKEQQAHLVRNACSALTQVLKRVLGRSSVGLVFAICSHQNPHSTQKLPIGVTTKIGEEDESTLQEASETSRELADALIGKRATKLHSFASRSHRVALPDFDPRNKGYVWGK